MATFKLDIKKEFGQLHHRVYGSSDPAPEYNGPIKDMKGLLETVFKALDERRVAPSDTVVFRQIGYDSREDLREAVRTAPY